MKQFWKSWKNKTKIEKSAIDVLGKGFKIILNNISKEKIIAIYVKGSFSKRELTKNSDVDVITIVKDTKTLKKLKNLHNKYSKSFNPKFEFGGYALWELKTGKRSKVRLRPGPGISRVVKHFKYNKLIYGKPINFEEFFTKSHEEDFKDMINLFKDLFFPMYNKNEMSFSDLIKQVFWLTDFEELFKGKNPPHSFKKLDKSIKDKNHIIHDALIFRLKPTKDKKLRERFIIKLKKHLNGLEKII